MNRSLTIVGLGEALFDTFPDKSLLGGAPLNVAVMAAQLLSCKGDEGFRPAASATMNSANESKVNFPGGTSIQIFCRETPSMALAKF